MTDTPTQVVAHVLYLHERDFHSVVGVLGTHAVVLRGYVDVRLGKLHVLCDEPHNEDLTVADPGYDAFVIGVAHRQAQHLTIQEAQLMGCRRPLDAFALLWRDWRLTPMSELTIIELRYATPDAEREEAPE